MVLYRQLLTPDLEGGSASCAVSFALQNCVLFRKHLLDPCSMYWPLSAPLLFCSYKFVSVREGFPLFCLPEYISLDSKAHITSCPSDGFCWVLPSTHANLFHLTFSFLVLVSQFFYPRRSWTWWSPTPTYDLLASPLQNSAHHLTWEVSSAFLCPPNWVRGPFLVLP